MQLTALEEGRSAMRTIMLAVIAVLLTSAACLAQGVPAKSAQPLAVAEPPGNPTSQDDPGECKLDLEKNLLIVLPPKTFKAPEGKACSVYCKLASEFQASEYGCDISAVPTADGSICSRPLTEMKGNVTLKGIVLRCDSVTP